MSHSSTNVLGAKTRPFGSRKQSHGRAALEDANQKKIRALKETYNQIAKYQQLTQHHRNLNREALM